MFEIPTGNTIFDSPQLQFKSEVAVIRILAVIVQQQPSKKTKRENYK